MAELMAFITVASILLTRNTNKNNTSTSTPISSTRTYSSRRGAGSAASMSSGLELSTGYNRNAKYIGYWIINKDINGNYVKCLPDSQDADPTFSYSKDKIVDRLSTIYKNWPMFKKNKKKVRELNINFGCTTTGGTPSSNKNAKNPKQLGFNSCYLGQDVNFEPSGQAVAKSGSDGTVTHDKIVTTVTDDKTISIPRWELYFGNQRGFQNDEMFNIGGWGWCSNTNFSTGESYNTVAKSNSTMPRDGYYIKPKNNNKKTQNSDTQISTSEKCISNHIAKYGGRRIVIDPSAMVSKICVSGCPKYTLCSGGGCFPQMIWENNSLKHLWTSHTKKSLTRINDFPSSKHRPYVLSLDIEGISKNFQFNKFIEPLKNLNIELWITIPAKGPSEPDGNYSSANKNFMRDLGDYVRKAATALEKKTKKEGTVLGGAYINFMMYALGTDSCKGQKPKGIGKRNSCQYNTSDKGTITEPKDVITNPAKDSNCKGITKEGPMAKKSVDEMCKDVKNTVKKMSLGNYQECSKYLGFTFSVSMKDKTTCVNQCLDEYEKQIITTNTKGIWLWAVQNTGLVNS